MSEYYVVRTTSSLTFSVAGVAKEVATLSLAIYFYNEHLSLINQVIYTRQRQSCLPSQQLCIRSIIICYLNFYTFSNIIRKFFTSFHAVYCSQIW